MEGFSQVIWGAGFPLQRLEGFGGCASFLPSSFLPSFLPSSLPFPPFLFLLAVSSLPPLCLCLLAGYPYAYLGWESTSPHLNSGPVPFTHTRIHTKTRKLIPANKRQVLEHWVGKPCCFCEGQHGAHTKSQGPHHPANG